MSSGTAASRRPAPNRRARRWLPYLGGGLLLLLITAGFWPKPVGVETAVTNRGLLRVSVNEEGKTRIKQRYLVAAPVPGQLRRIPFKAGAEVIVDKTVVAVIDPLSPTLLDERTRAAAEARRASAFANLEKARAAHDFSASELRRFTELFAAQTISIQELEAARARESSAAHEQNAAVGALQMAQAELAQFTSPGSDTNQPCAAREIRAPTSGRVLRVLEENARAINTGTALLEIGDPSEMEVVVEVLSRDGARIAPGSKVELDQWGGTEPLMGRVRLVEPAAFTKVSALGVEEQRVNVIVDLTTAPDRRPNLGDNFRVEARIIIWEEAEALKVPSGALFRQGDHWATFKIEEGRAKLQPLKVGHSSGTETEILDGLNEGETVALYPSSRVHDGQRVTGLRITTR